MFSTRESPHIVILVIVETLVITVWALEEIVIQVEVKRNSTSIKWDEKLSERKNKEFKQMSLVVRNQLRKDLEKLQGTSEIIIKVKKFIENEGNTFCEIECKVNSQQVSEEDIKNAVNATIDIGAVSEISYTRVNMTLTLPSLLWVDAYNDHNSSEYKNLTTTIKAALSEVYEDTDDVVSFEIVSVSEAPDGSLVVEFHVLVDPDSALKIKDLEETLQEFTKDDRFGKMITGVKKRQQEEETGGDDEEDESNKAPVGLIVFAAVIMCLVIITFVVAIVRQNWKYIKEHSPEARFESYQRKSDYVQTVTITEQPRTATIPTISVDNAALDVSDVSLDVLDVSLDV